MSVRRARVGEGTGRTITDVQDGIRFGQAAEQDDRTAPIRIPVQGRHPTGELVLVSPVAGTRAGVATRLVVSESRGHVPEG